MCYGGLMFLPEGSRPAKTALTVAGLCEGALPNWSVVVATSRNLSQLVGTCRNLSQLVGTCRNSCGLKGPTLGPYISKGLQVYCLQAASIMPAGRFLQARGTEGGPADLARSTAEGVGGFSLPWR